MMTEPRPGLVLLLGSGETSPGGRRVWEWLLQRRPPGRRIAILETPAGFEPNSDRVAGKIAEFLRLRLQNHEPQPIVIPARKRGSPLDPDDPAVAAPLLRSDVIFMGPGSPTYAVRQLLGSQSWHHLQARQRVGADLFLASSAVIAAGSQALPVYEIYKVGEDLHWHPGLDLLRDYGLSLVFVPHWNNNDGGTELDTSRCYMGRNRFEQLLDLLPPGDTVVGIDEQTALVMDLEAGGCQVVGPGSITILLAEQEPLVFGSNQTFPVGKLGPFQRPKPGAGIPVGVWARALNALSEAPAPPAPQPGPEVLALVARREEARRLHDWQAADALRRQVAELGWEIRDTTKGPELIWSRGRADS